MREGEGDDNHARVGQCRCPIIPLPVCQLGPYLPFCQRAGGRQQISNSRASVGSSIEGYGTSSLVVALSLRTLHAGLNGTVHPRKFRSLC